MYQRTKSTVLLQGLISTQDELGSSYHRNSSGNLGLVKKKGKRLSKWEGFKRRHNSSGIPLVSKISGEHKSLVDGFLESIYSQSSSNLLSSNGRLLKSKIETMTVSSSINFMTNSTNVCSRQSLGFIGTLVNQKRSNKRKKIHPSDNLSRTELSNKIYQMTSRIKHLEGQDKHTKCTIDRIRQKQSKLLFKKLRKNKFLGKKTHTFKKTINQFNVNKHPSIPKSRPVIMNKSLIRNHHIVVGMKKERAKNLSRLAANKERQQRENTIKVLQKNVNRKMREQEKFENELRTVYNRKNYKKEILFKGRNKGKKDLWSKVEKYKEKQKMILSKLNNRILLKNKAMEDYSFLISMNKGTSKKLFFNFFKDEELSVENISTDFTTGFLSSIGKCVTSRDHSKTQDGRRRKKGICWSSNGYNLNNSLSKASIPDPILHDSTKTKQNNNCSNISKGLLRPNETENFYEMKNVSNLKECFEGIKSNEWHGFGSRENCNPTEHRYYKFEFDIEN